MVCSCIDAESSMSTCRSSIMWLISTPYWLHFQKRLVTLILIRFEGNYRLSLFIYLSLQVNCLITTWLISSNPCTTEKHNDNLLHCLKRTCTFFIFFCISSFNKIFFKHMYENWNLLSALMTLLRSKISYSIM